MLLMLINFIISRFVSAWNEHLDCTAEIFGNYVYSKLEYSLLYLYIVVFGIWDLTLFACDGDTFFTFGNVLYTLYSEAFSITYAYTNYGEK
jgi:hypothetical protein